MTGRVPPPITLQSGPLRVALSPYGARLQGLWLNGDDRSLTLGSADHDDYLGPLKYAGPIVGPVANRIGGASFRIDGTEFDTDRNELDKTTLHGGFVGLDTLVWQTRQQTADQVTFAVDLPDGLGGFPGNRKVAAQWTTREESGDRAILDLILTATTDAKTPMNLAHHPYWCLDQSGGDSLRVLAAHYLPIDADTLPTGQIVPVAGTPYDLRVPRALSDPDLPPLDTNFCLSSTQVLRRRVATLSGANGQRLDIETTEPGLQVFTGLGHSPGGPGTAGIFVALEPQGWPDAVNHDAFPSILMTPDAPYVQHTRYVFSGATGPDAGHIS